MAALVLFIVFVAAFFTVLIRLSRIGITTERYAHIENGEVAGEYAATARFDLLEQDDVTGKFRFNAEVVIDTQSDPFVGLEEGQVIVMRVENLLFELRHHRDYHAVFHNYTNDRYVSLEFGEFLFNTQDRRDFYPFDSYSVSLNYAIHVTPNERYPLGIWYEPGNLEIWSKTNMIFLNPRYGTTSTGPSGYKMRVARLRIQQFMTVSLLLVEILFLLYLLTIIDLQELLGKGLGYLVGLFIIRGILVTRAPIFPTLVDYGTMFLICVVFFLMLFKFLGGAEARAIITIPPAWREAITGEKEIKSDTPHEDDDEI